MPKSTTRELLTLLQSEVAELRQRVELLERPIGPACPVCEMTTIEIAIAEGVPRDLISERMKPDGTCPFCAGEIERDTVSAATH